MPDHDHDLAADWTVRAFDLVTEITKQVLSLAAAIIAVSITFFSDFAIHASTEARALMATSWLMYLISVVFGLLTLMGSAGVQQAKATALLTPPDTRDQACSAAAAATINSGNLRTLGAIQLVAFLLALLTTAVAGAAAL